MAEEHTIELKLSKESIRAFSKFTKLLKEMNLEAALLLESIKDLDASLHKLPWYARLFFLIRG